MALALALASIVAAPVGAQERATIGSGPWAMPSLHRVLVASETEPGVDVAAMGGYAYTEDVLGMGDAHHRVAGDVALAGRPLSWLTIAGRVDGRWDHHVLGGTADQSAVGEARLALRGDFDVVPGLALGLAGIVFVPGSDAPSLTFDATTLDLRGLAAWTPEGTSLTIALDLGFRLDRTAYAVQRPVPYGRADLVSLGASDSNALLIGAGAVVRVDAIELFGEVSADVLVERGLAASPVRVALGMRAPLVPRLLALHVALEAGLSGRLPIDPAGTLTPVEPRIALVVGLVLSPRSGPAVIEPVDSGPAPVTGRVLDPSGTPIAGARVHVAGAPEPSTRTDGDGAFTLEGVPDDAQIEVEADGYVTTTLARSSTELTLERALPEGTLRGLVRSLSGRPVVATIEVQPGGARATTDADGVFELALTPGHYELAITAPGHHAQNRTIDVEVGGVTVINVDLRSRR